MLRKLFRYGYYQLYGRTGKRIQVNGETYTVSAHVARGINSVIDEGPLKLLCKLCVNADIVFDIGANIGIISTILSKRMKPGSVIYAFEPAPLSFKYLKDTARVQKGNARIVPVNAAVSNNTSPISFVNDGNSCTNHIAASGEQNTISITPVIIDAWCAENKVVPQLIKIDVEGAEYWALDGMRSTLRNNDCIVLVEVHGGYLMNNGITAEMLGSLIDSVDYKSYDPLGNQISNNEVINQSFVVLSKLPLVKETFQGI